MHEDATEAVEGDSRGGENAQGASLEALGTVPLNGTHDIANFCCTKSARVQAFLRDHAHPYVADNYCRVFVWPSNEDPTRLMGYYSLSACLIQRDELNNRFQRKAPKGIPVPMVLVGYMGKADGVPKPFGATLMLDAARRVSRITDLGIWGIALDAENDELVRWYQSLNFTLARTRSRLMYAPLSALLVSSPQK